MNKNYVRLDENNADDEVLIREIKESYFEKTFGDLIAYMSDDGKYEESGEKALARRVRSTYENASRGNTSVSIVCLTNDDPPQDLSVRLEDRLSEYKPRILRPHSSDSEGDSKVIDISVDENHAGGSSYLYNGR